MHKIGIEGGLKSFEQVCTTHVILPSQVTLESVQVCIYNGVKKFSFQGTDFSGTVNPLMTNGSAGDPGFESQRGLSESYSNSGFCENSENTFL